MCLGRVMWCGVERYLVMQWCGAALCGVGWGGMGWRYGTLVCGAALCGVLVCGLVRLLIELPYPAGKATSWMICGEGKAKGLCRWV